MARSLTALDATRQKGGGGGSLSSSLKNGGVLGSRCRDLKFSSCRRQMTHIRQAPEFQLCGSRSGTGALGPDGTRRALSRPRSAALPGTRHRLVVEGFPPTVWTGSPISSEAAHLSDSLFATMGLRARPACPQGPGTLPSSLRPVTSPRSRQQLKGIWGSSHCLHSGLQSSLARSPKTGSTHWGTEAIVSQLAPWAMEAGPGVAHPPQVGVRERPGPAGKVSGEASVSPVFPSPSPTAQFGQ